MTDAELAAGRAWRRQALLWAGAGVIAGACLAAGGVAREATLGLIPAGLLLARLPRRRPRPRVMAVFLGAGLCLGAGRAVTGPGHFGARAAETVALDGVVADAPRALGAVNSVVVAVSHSSDPGLTGARVSVSSAGAFRAGDVVDGQVRLRPPAAASGSDLAATGSGLLHLDARAHGPETWPAEARQWLADGMTGALPSPEASLASGVGLGLRGPLPADLSRSFQASGLVHLLVTSGLKIGIAAALASALLRGLGLGRAWWVTGLVMVGFSSLAGGSVAAGRATVSGVLGMLALALGRPHDAWNTLCLAGAGFLLLDPGSAGSVGFLLTFMGTGGILALVPLAPRLSGPLRRLAEPALVTLAASLATAPVTLSAFHLLSPWSIPANALALPAIPVLLPLVLLTGGLGQLAPPIAWLPALASWALLRWLEGVATVAAALPGLVDLPSLPAGAAFAWYLVLGLLLARLHSRSRLRPTRAGGLAA
ncbi:MAG: ComEC/Rec2 family competence protein [Candidatus Dormibacteria bacterium]